MITDPTFILGVVDHYGCCHSQPATEGQSHASTHGNTLPRCRWRWSKERGLHWITEEVAPDKEERFIIRAHLESRYNIYVEP